MSAFVAESRLTLGELAVDEKSNEITAVPELLKFLDIEKSVVTADAMSCQSEIVKTIVKGKADYVIAAKRNQPGLYKFIKDKFHELSAKAEKVVTSERRRSQNEERAYCLLTDLSGLPKPEKWPELKAVGRVVTTVRKGGTVHIQTRYYISSITEPNGSLTLRVNTGRLKTSSIGVWMRFFMRTIPAQKKTTPL